MSYIYIYILDVSYMCSVIDVSVLLADLQSMCVSPDRVCPMHKRVKVELNTSGVNLAP